MEHPEKLKGAERREYGLRKVDEGFSIAQVARLMDVKESTVYRWCLNRHREFGKHNCFKRLELSDWEQSQLFDFIESCEPSETVHATSDVDKCRPTSGECGSCDCEQRISQIIRLLCPRNCSTRDSTWSTKMVQQLLRVQFPHSAQAHWNPQQIERWLISHGLTQTTLGWRRYDSEKEAEEQDNLDMAFDFGFADFDK
jgi:hypothetical protein